MFFFLNWLSWELPVIQNTLLINGHDFVYPFCLPLGKYCPPRLEGTGLEYHTHLIYLYLLIYLCYKFFYFLFFFSSDHQFSIFIYVLFHHNHHFSWTITIHHLYIHMLSVSKSPFDIKPHYDIIKKNIYIKNKKRDSKQIQKLFYSNSESIEFSGRRRQVENRDERFALRRDRSVRKNVSTQDPKRLGEQRRFRNVSQPICRVWRGLDNRITLGCYYPK